MIQFDYIALERKDKESWILMTCFNSYIYFFFPQALILSFGEGPQSVAFNWGQPTHCDANQLLWSWGPEVRSRDCHPATCTVSVFCSHLLSFPFLPFTWSSWNVTHYTTLSLWKIAFWRRGKILSNMLFSSKCNKKPKMWILTQEAQERK